MTNIEQFRNEWAQLQAEWVAMPQSERRRQWEGFTEALDCGDAGYHRYHEVLFPLWELGEAPD